jgi:hypothetical protein
VAAVQLWCEVTVVGPDGADLVRRFLEGPGDPDLEAVDEVARLALLAGRLGSHLVLAEVSPALRALLHLTGLCVEVEGQSKLGEQPLGVQERQEERHAGDEPV